jgi:hypothetical protein
MVERAPASEVAVRQVFISYARSDRPRVEALAERLRRLVDGVWFDSQLHGGEDWWAGILDRIRGCDIFLAVVSTASMESEACRIEREYAMSVNRTIVPVALEAVPPALPSDVATLQIVDFSTPGEQALSDLARALLAAADPEPLPDRLPPDPDAPLSYLTDLVDLVSCSRELTKSEQMEIVFQLERGLESSDHDEREGARQVLQRMKARDDLAASVEKTIDLLARDQVPSVPPASSQEQQQEQPRPAPPPARPTPAQAAAVQAPAPAAPQPRPSAAQMERNGQTQRGAEPRRRVAILAVVALVLLAVAAGLGWVLLGGGGDDATVSVGEPQPRTTQPSLPSQPGEPQRTEPPAPADPYSRACPSPVESYPGEVEAYAVETDYPDDRILSWACLLYEEGVIGNYESNFTGNYGGELPPRVEQEKQNLGYPASRATGMLDRQFYDCLVNGVCPRDESSTTPPTPGPTPGPTPTADIL